MQRLRAEASGKIAPEGFVREGAAEAPKADAAGAVVEAKAEPVKETPKPVEFSDDPQSWPEPARQALESTKAELASFQERISKFEEIAPRAIEQNQRLAEELKLARALLEQNGLSLDQRDLDLLGYRVKENNAQKMAEMQAARDAQAAEMQAEARKAQAATQAQGWLADAQTQAKKAGVEFADVGEILMGQLAAKKSPDIARAIALVQGQQLAKQREANRAAPSPIVSSVPAGTTLPRDRTTQGRLDRLRQLGHAV